MTSKPDKNENFQVVAARAIVINDKNEVLFVSENGKNWHLPGGWIETLEDPMLACEREVYEETGFITKAHKIIYVTEFVEDITPPYPGIKQKFDLYCYCTIEGNQEIDHNWIDHDNELISHRKFMTNDEWKTSNNLYIPTGLKSLNTSDIKNAPSCFNKITLI